MNNNSFRVSDSPLQSPRPGVCDDNEPPRRAKLAAVPEAMSAGAGIFATWDSDTAPTTIAATDLGSASAATAPASSTTRPDDDECGAADHPLRLVGRGGIGSGSPSRENIYCAADLSDGDDDGGGDAAAAAAALHYQHPGHNGPNSPSPCVPGQIGINVVATSSQKPSSQGQRAGTGGGGDTSTAADARIVSGATTLLRSRGSSVVSSPASEARNGGIANFPSSVPSAAAAAAAVAPPSVDYSALPRYGFPCRLAPPIAVREEARAHTLLTPHLAASDQAWRAGVRSVSLLAQADGATCESLRRLSRKFGCPPHLRGLVWLTVTKVALRLDEHPDGYGACLERAIPEAIVPAHVVNSIEQDLERTFPEHAYFKHGAEGHWKLRWVLQNLWRRAPSTGYCQAFNFLAATFLLALGGDQEAALWTMVLVLETLLPCDYYGATLHGVKIDQRVFRDLVRTHVPKVSQHFDAIDFDCGMLVPVWLMSGFTNVLPIESALAVWDFVFAGEVREQTPALLAVATALIKIHADAIIVTTDPSDTAMLLHQLTDITFDWTKVLKAAAELPISSEAVATLRRRYRALAAQEAIQNEARRDEGEAAQKRLASLRQGGAAAREAIRASADSNAAVSYLASASASAGGAVGSAASREEIFTAPVQFANPSGVASSRKDEVEMAAISSIGAPPLP